MELQSPLKVDGATANEPASAITAITSEVVPNEFVEFRGIEDHRNPLNWTSGYKWTVVVIVSLMTMISNVATYICAPAIPQMQAELDAESDLISTLLICIFGLGNVCGPLLIAPLAEIYGRRTIYHVANVLFVIFSLATGFTTNIGSAIFLRFLTAASAACLPLNPAIIGDMFAKERRGGAMAIMSITPLLGTAIGPVIGGYVATFLGWRWTFWIQALLTAAAAILLMAVLRETYSVTILKSMARRLRKETGNDSFHSRFDHDPTMSSKQVFRRAMLRPMALFCGSWPLVLASIYAAGVFGLSYVTLTTILFVFPDQYSFGSKEVGFVYLGVATGMAFGTLICAMALDGLQRRAARRGESKAEVRVHPNTLSAILVPAGLLLYGWPAEYKVHWMVPIVGIAIQSTGLAITNITIQNYIVDAFGIYAASASAVLTVMRFFVATVLPLAAPPMINAIGNGWSSLILTGISLMTVPVLYVLIKFGSDMRARSTLRLDV